MLHKLGICFNSAVLMENDGDMMFLLRVNRQYCCIVRQWEPKSAQGTEVFALRIWPPVS